MKLGLDEVKVLDHSSAGSLEFNQRVTCAKMASEVDGALVAATVHILPCKIKTDPGRKSDVINFPASNEFHFFGRRLVGVDAEFPPEYKAAIAFEEEGVFEVSREFPCMKLWGHDNPQGPGDEVPKLLSYLGAVSKMHLV
mmetsp:Transcript_8867/g.17177  ORF Transcript_8867/g.17177 Transcript_8867/m.17177 type:complete len:140 (-) Transcript_8867:14-433(-)